MDASVIEARESSFEDAQVIGARLAEILTASCGNGETMPEEVGLKSRSVIVCIVNEIKSKRGLAIRSFDSLCD